MRTAELPGDGSEGQAARGALRLMARLGTLRTFASLLPELAVIGGFLVFLWAGLAAVLYHERGAAGTTAVNATANLARALEESARRTIGQIDTILMSGRAAFQEKGERFDFNAWARGQVLSDKMTAQIGMAGANGEMIGSTLPMKPGTSIADRPHFLVHNGTGPDALYISHPVIGRVSKQESIQFSRRMTRQDGTFGGVAVFSLASAELARFYEALQLGEGFVAILSTDGTVLARGPKLTEHNGSLLAAGGSTEAILTRSSGAAMYRDIPSGLKQITSFRRLADYPLIVMVGVDEETAFRAYRSLRDRAVVSGLAITLAVCGIGGLWVRQKRRSLQSRQSLAITLDTISQGVLMVDGRGTVRVINPRAAEMLALPGESQGAIAARATALLARHAGCGPAGGDQASQAFETSVKPGQMLAVRAHALADGGFVQTFTDVTRERESDARMRYMDDHDALTGLANRSRIRALLTDAIRHGAGAGTRAAVLIVDLDGFKAVNETYGHNTGDALLAEVGARLRVLAGSENAVARLGADEFAVVATGLRQATAVATLAARIVSSLAEPKAIRSDRLRTGASVGIALYPKDGDDADTLFRNAAAALDSAKAFGCNTFRFYDHAMGQAVSEQRQLEADLRKALDDDALDVHFQPKFNSQTLALSGFEALARWRHPERGNVSPGVFIPLAERCGLIRLLGQRILEKTCRCAAAWPRTYPVAVNVSVPQLRDGALKEQIEAILEETGLGASHLEIEVTESVVAEDGQTVLANLEAIRAMGIRVSLDDFGTGYSSLSYLRRFPFDKIKIDRAFVQGQADDPGVRVILEMILGMCQRLGLGTIGEGIETQAQLDVLREHGCTEVQGFLLGRPMPQGAAIAFIETVVAAAADPGGQAPAELMLAS